jgi:hypothetical protein
MAPAALAPERDAIASYTLGLPSDPATLNDPEFIHSASEHIRGIAAGPEGDGPDAYRFIVSMGRNKGGLTVFRREGGGKMVPVISNVLEKEISLPVGAVWF